MKFEHSITVRSQPGRNADYGRALERVAFFPGVTEANLIGAEVGLVTIGHYGKECDTALRKFHSDLEADGLVADGPLWEVGQPFVGRITSSAIAQLRYRTRREHIQSTAIASEFERRS